MYKLSRHVKKRFPSPLRECGGSHPALKCVTFHWNPVSDGATTAAVPPPIRHGEPARCGSHPLVTPY